ncbi:HMA2 domain-containing protein [Methylocystis sp. IM3]|uniref:HMA2 domain-containing protein n=1 Tax=unclassified Methylocystis TaxID=2625913 RepID=UPI0030F51936
MKPAMLLHFHHVPGRLRVELASIRRNRQAAEAAANALRALPGVTAVSTSPAIGSLTVSYDPRRIAPHDLTAALDRQGCLGPKGAAAPAASSKGLASRAGDMAAQALVEAVLRRMLGDAGSMLARLIA